MDCTTNIDNLSTHSERSSHASTPNGAIKPLSPVNNNSHTANNHNHYKNSPRQSPLSLAYPPATHHLQMPHPLSPPPVGPRLAQSLQAHLPPPGLGLLGSLSGMGGMLGHHGPLDLMAAHHGPPRSYNSPPPISTSDPIANECKLVDYRGQKVAAFIINGDTMLCLPQAFELFLKHLVGGLHTVYTKLKRLDIMPLVCNVEQVRILRGLGAIQPGVNRCKLLSCKDFDVLYKDCTTASSRPGRPPKRAPVGLSLAASQLHHQQLKKHRLDNGEYSPYDNGHTIDISRLEKSPLISNGYNHPPPHLSHMQFMQLSHPAAAHAGLLSSAMPHGLTNRSDGSIIKNHALPPSMEAIARSGIWENCRAAYEDIVKHLERYSNHTSKSLRDERNDVDRALALDQKVRELHSHNGSPTGEHSPVLNLSKSGGNTVTDGSLCGSADDVDRRDLDQSGSEADLNDDASVIPTSAPHTPRSEHSRSVRSSPRSSRSRNGDDDEDRGNVSEMDDEDKDQDMDARSDIPPRPVQNSDSQQAVNYSTALTVNNGSARGDLSPRDLSPRALSPARSDDSNDGVTSMHETSPLGDATDASGGGAASSAETLLRNIQGLLKVAAENARNQERQINFEKGTNSNLIYLLSLAQYYMYLAATQSR